MICTSVIPCLSSDLAKNDRVMSCLSYFPAFLAILKFWLFVENRGDKHYTKAVKHDILVNF